MIKKIFPAFVAAAFGFGLQSSALAQTCTPVDAITTSTLKLTNQSKACETTADLVFTYTKTNGSRAFTYGKTTSYGTNGGNISGAAKTTTINLTGLESGTKYYFKVTGVYQGTTEYTMTGSFTTNASVNIKPVTLNSAAHTSIITLGKNTVTIPSGSDNTLKIQLFSMNGTLVFKHDVFVENRVASLPQELFNATGIYLCRITGATTMQNQVVSILK